MKKLDAFEKAYIDCALWSSVDDDGESIDAKYSIEDLADETLEKIIKDCRQFQIKAESFLVDLDEAQCGHDFWLTRNHHGAGFWCRGYSKLVGDTLTKMSHSFGECNLYVGDDGKLHL